MLVTVGCVAGTTGEEPAWIEETLGHVVTHLHRRPEATAVDLYKLLHQAVAGPAHAVDDAAAAWRILQREVARMPVGEPVEPLCEPLGGDPPMVRVNLRPYVAAGGDLEALASAFAASAVVHEDVTIDLAAVLDVAVARLAASRPQTASDLEDLSTELRAAGFPAVHHSQSYRQAYSPAYRVVRRSLAPCPDG